MNHALHLLMIEKENGKWSISLTISYLLSYEYCQMVITLYWYGAICIANDPCIGMVQISINTTPAARKGTLLVQYGPYLIGVVVIKEINLAHMCSWHRPFVMVPYAREESFIWLCLNYSSVE